MRVRDLLRNKQQNTITIGRHADIAAAARLLMRHGIGALPVVAPEDTVIGLISERDIVRAIDVSGEEIRHAGVERFMRRPAPSCRADDALQDAMARMTRERLRHLVVMDGARVAGVISVGDLVKHRLEQLETETGVLRDYVAAHRASPT